MQNCFHIHYSFDMLRTIKNRSKQKATIAHQIYLYKLVSYTTGM